MPSKNTIKEYVTDSYYHVYNRGVEKRVIFLDEQDYAVFLGLLKKYLTGEKDKTASNRHAFDNLASEVKLVAYCLMPNHFHMLLYQSSEQGISRLMRRLVTGYVMYFNDRYSRVGSLFQGVYKASYINADAYLDHISRYIHLNPEDYEKWPYSSYPYYMGYKKAAWVVPDMILSRFDDDPREYKLFLDDYIEVKRELAVLKHQLANDPDDM